MGCCNSTSERDEDEDNVVVQRNQQRSQQETFKRDQYRAENAAPYLANAEFVRKRNTGNEPNNINVGRPSNLNHDSHYVRRQDNESNVFRVEPKRDLRLNTTNRETHESFDVRQILSFPSQWTSYCLNKTGFVNISPKTQEGKSVETFFNRSSKSKEFDLKIIEITRIENPFLYSMYLLKKEEMESRNGHVDELFLFHGTKEEYVQDICKDNLNWRLCQQHKFGKGVSFSPISNYSSHYGDKRSINVMLLVKVLVCNATFGSVRMTIPRDENGVTFDTSINENTTVIVKYSDNEFYPLYKIIYKKLVFNAN